MVEVQITQPNESQHKLGGGRNKPRVPSQAKPTATVTIKHPCLIFMAKKPHICDKLGKIKLFFSSFLLSFSLRWGYFLPSKRRAIHPSFGVAFGAESWPDAIALLLTALPCFGGILIFELFNNFNFDKN